MHRPFIYITFDYVSVKPQRNYETKLGSSEQPVCVKSKNLNLFFQIYAYFIFEVEHL